MKFLEPFKHPKLNEFFMGRSSAYKLKEFAESPFIKAMLIDEKIVKLSEKAKETIINSNDIGSYLTNEGKVITKNELTNNYKNTTNLINDFITALQSENYKDIIEVKRENRKKQNNTQKPQKIKK